MHLRFLASFESVFAGYYDNIFEIAIAPSVHEIYRVFDHSLNYLVCGSEVYNKAPYTYHRMTSSN